MKREALTLSSGAASFARERDNLRPRAHSLLRLSSSGNSPWCEDLDSSSSVASFGDGNTRGATGTLVVDEGVMEEKVEIFFTGEDAPRAAPVPAADGVADQWSSRSSERFGRCGDADD